MSEIEYVYVRQPATPLIPEGPPQRCLKSALSYAIKQGLEPCAAPDAPKKVAAAPAPTGEAPAVRPTIVDDNSQPLAVIQNKRGRGRPRIHPRPDEVTHG